MRESLRSRALIKAERPLSYYLNVAQVTLRPLTMPALAVGALAFGVFAGLLAAKLPPVITLMALANLAVLLVAFSRPDLVILLMLTISSSIIDPRAIPSISVGFRFTAVEMCLILLLGLVVARFLSSRGETDFVRTPLDLPLLLFFAASTISFFNALYNLGETRGWLVPYWRVLFDYLVFFAVTNLVRTRQQLVTLVSGLLVMTTIMAALMIVQGAVGPSVKVIPNASLGYATAFDQEFVGVTRVLPAGVSLIFIMLFPALILHTTPEYLRARKWLSLIPLLLLPVAIALTFNRTWWAGTLVSLIILLFISPASQRKKLIIFMCVLVMILSLSVYFLNAYIPRTGNIVEALYLRAASFFAVARIESGGGDEWRLRENEAAMIRIKEHPLLGVGPGGKLRHEWWLGDGFTRFMHNSYLFILADLGILGFLPFLWFSVAYLVRGFVFGLTLQDPVLKGWVLGLTLGYIALLIAGAAGAELVGWHTTPVIGVMLGVNEVAIKLGQQSA